ncbi:MAG: O-antigen ligase family protein [Chitinivibrionia bacterium]|nr:O-antigen ligase family protein [Chitinivibrionia bacterium]
MRSSFMSKTGQFALSKGLAVAAVALLAAAVGFQVYDPSKRFIEAVVGVIFIALISRFSLVSSLLFFMLMYIFPFALKVGSSNVVFIPLILIIWLIRVSVRNVARPIGSLADWIVVLMAISYILSFYNNPGGAMLVFALQNSFAFLVAVGLFYLIVNFVRDAKTLQRIVTFQVMSCLFVAIFCILELLFPGRAIIPGWLHTFHRETLVMENVRIQGPFHDFELLAEFFALNIPIILFMFVRSRRMLHRFGYFGLVLLVIGLLMATSTRGAFISLFIGALYMLWIIRRDLNIVRLVYIIAVVAAMFAVTEVFVSKYTISGGMMKRLLGTKFVGYIPDTRTRAWPKAVERWKQHPIIGHSPSWDYSQKLEKWNWPHNGYLFYMNITGLVGLAAFLLLLYKLMRASIAVKSSTMFDSSFPRAFMLILHVDLVIFAIDELKIDYLRNQEYTLFVWLIFGFIAATYSVALNEERTSEAAERPEERT